MFRFFIPKRNKAFRFSGYFRRRVIESGGGKGELDCLLGNLRIVLGTVSISKNSNITLLFGTYAGKVHPCWLGSPMITGGEKGQLC